MTAFRSVESRDASLAATTIAGRQLKTLKELAEFVASRRDLVPDDYEFIGQLAVAMATAEHGTAADADTLLKLRDVHHVAIPSREAAAAFTSGENKAAARLAEVDPHSRAFATFVADLDRRATR